MDDKAELSTRVGDRDRDRVVEQLHTYCRDGQLSLDEFAERVSSALTATTHAQLVAVVDDLPALTEPVRDQRGLGWSVAILGSNRRRVRWRLARRARAIAVGGTCWLDLRSALIDADEVQITATAILGTVKVVVPKGIGVELTGITLIGAKSDKTSGGMLPKGPVVRVRGFPIVGSVRVIEVNPPSPEAQRLREDIIRKKHGLPPAERGPTN
ncbi:MAG TPA: DUF1707 domain-containing protein [Acidimicrobiales bacterium]|nr:DUF1707 domain-containing protein [Acidimicrobiales bacterium]